MKSPSGIKKLAVVLLIVAGLVLVVNKFKDQFVRSAVAFGISQATGSKTTIGGFAFHLFKQTVRIRDLTIYNPPGFPPEPAVHFPEIDVDYDLPALLKKKLHVSLIVVDLREVTVVRGKDGKLNVDAFKFMQKSDQEFKLDIQEMQFDMLSLSIGRVIYKDLTNPAAPPQPFYVNLHDKTFRDIRSPQQFASLILFEALKSTTIKAAAVSAIASKFGYGSLATQLVGNLLASDEASLDFDRDFEKVYPAALAVAQALGSVKNESQSTGIIKAAVQGADVVVRVTKVSGDRINVKVSARQLLIPKPDVAGNVLYAIEEKLSK